MPLAKFSPKSTVKTFSLTIPKSSHDLMFIHWLMGAHCSSPDNWMPHKHSMASTQRYRTGDIRIALELKQSMECKQTIPALGRLMQNSEFLARLGYIEKPYLKILGTGVESRGSRVCVLKCMHL